MKIKYLKLRHWLIAAFAGLLGIPVACEHDPLALEYGCPMATYHVKGTVTNDKGQPIPGIGVVRWDMGTPSEEDDVYGDTTDAEGRYDIISEYTPPGMYLKIDFRDIDGSENGSYNDTIVRVSTADVHLTGGDGHWFEGEGTVTQDVVMTSKTNE